MSIHVIPYQNFKENTKQYLSILHFLAFSVTKPHPPTIPTEPHSHIDEVCHDPHLQLVMVQLSHPLLSLRGHKNIDPRLAANKQENKQTN